MSFNNPLTFNLSKSSATTSTTNTNTVHVSSSTNGISAFPIGATKDSAGSGDKGTVNSTPIHSADLSRSPFLQNILHRASNSALDSESKLGSPTTVVTADNGTSNKVDRKTDLVGLFDKFDVKLKDDDEKDTVEDVYEHKYGAEEDVKEDGMVEIRAGKGHEIHEKVHRDEENDDNHRDNASEEAENLDENKGDSFKQSAVESNVQKINQPDSEKLEPKKTNSSNSNLVASMMTIQPYDPFGGNDQKETEKQPTEKQPTEKQPISTSSADPQNSIEKEGEAVNSQSTTELKPKGVQNKKSLKQEETQGESLKQEKTQGSLKQEILQTPLEPLIRDKSPQKAKEPQQEEPQTPVILKEEQEESEAKQQKELNDEHADSKSNSNSAQPSPNPTQLESFPTIKPKDKLLDLTGTSEVTSIEEIHGPKGDNDENDEKHRESHKPFDFQNFLVHLRKKSADPIVRYIRSFLVSFSRQAHTFTLEQRVKVVRDFKLFMNDKFLLFQPFASMDDIDLENSREGLEKLIMNRIYSNCFPPEIIKQSSTYLPETCRKDLEADAVFSQQLEKFSWINGSHLDIDLELLKNDMVEYSTTELNKINNYRAPRDKIICILNCCKIIFSFLKVSNHETNADAFVPLLILILIKAKTPNLVSNIHYIESYRGEEWLSYGETSYYLSSLQGAINFINTISVESLSIDEKEFNAHMEAWEAQQKQQPEIQQPLLQQPQPQHSEQGDRPIQESLSPSNVLFTSAELISRSISNLLASPGDSPAPEQHEARPEHQSELASRRGSRNSEPSAPNVDDATVELTFKSMKEMFPQLEDELLRDVVYMNKGNVDQTLDACLQLTEG